MWPFEDARSTVLSHAQPLSSESVVLEAALGRCLSAPFVARLDNPAFDNSSVDGYAVRAAEVSAGVLLPLQATVNAGSSAPELPPGACMAVFTGAPLPVGADAVVMQEDAERGDGEVRFKHALPAGSNVRLQGEEYRVGDPLLPIGTPVTPPVVALLAMNGATSAPVHRSPSVCIVSTGNELAEPGQARGPNQVYDGNGPGLMAAARSLGISDARPSRVVDREDLLRVALKDALSEADVVVTSGGVSVGEKDLIKGVWAELGVEQVIWQVAMRPGKPFYFGVGHGKLVFGLPGNPVSALVCFHLFCRPALLKLMGFGEEALKPICARLTAETACQAERTDFIRGRLAADGDGLSATPLRDQGSHMLGGLASANCLIRIPPGSEAMLSGAQVEAYSINWTPV